MFNNNLLIIADAFLSRFKLATQLQRRRR